MKCWGPFPMFFRHSTLKSPWQPWQEGIFLPLCLPGAWQVCMPWVLLANSAQSISGSDPPCRLQAKHLITSGWPWRMFFSLCSSNGHCARCATRQLRPWSEAKDDTKQGPGWPVINVQCDNSNDESLCCFKPLGFGCLLLACNLVHLGWYRYYD